ncbi:discoidin domain-containing protein [Streptomyces sp. NPDC051940]|uniref:discoidin domain-containing protein n=1 Tax=Streptomyces sp. NPDC051940 TaxID=3155675 RepID=UPI0034291E65
MRRSPSAVLRPLSAVVSALALLLLSPAPEAHAAAPTVWVQSAADRAFSSSVRPSGASGAVALRAARGEMEAAQILVRPTENVTGVQVTAGALTGPGGATLPVTVRREYNHPHISKIGVYQNPPDGGTAYYDALVENTPQSLGANTTLAYHYSVRTAPGQTPGTYTGTAVVKSSGGDTTVPVSVTVYNVTLPAADQSTFRMNNWFTSAGWDYNGTIRSIPAQYGVQMYDANWWKVITNMAANHARHRNNVIFADFQALLMPDSTVDANGTYTFGWATFDRFVQTFVDAGAMQYLYTPHLLEPQSGDVIKMDMMKQVGGTMQRVLADPDTAETNAYLDQLFPALKAHLDAKGWTDQFYMSALDEPSTTNQVNAAKWLYAKYRQSFPAPLTNEAHLAVLPQLEQDLTTATPYTGLYDDNVGYYQRRRLSGADLWLYNCIVPQNERMNRFISYHLASTRLTPWLTWKIGGTGYLHWGWNFWWDFSDLNRPSDTFDDWQTGDNWLVRPNKPAYDVYDSVRSETQLDGLEDVELLNLLKQTKPVTAAAIANTLITDSVTYEHSGTEVDSRHRQILDALASPAPDLAFPYADDFASGETSWRHRSGTWSVSAGEYAQTDTANWGETAALEGRAYGDVVASADLRITGVNANGGNTNWAGVMLRNLNGTDMDSGYLIAQRNNGEVFVYRSGTTLASATVPGYSPGGWNNLRVAARGSTITVFSGARKVLTVTDSAYKAGGFALVTGGAGARFDNVRINPEVNPAEARTVTASSSYEADGWSTAGATDGQRTGLGWSSSTAAMGSDHTEWLQVDLGASRRLDRIDLYPRSDGTNAGQGFPVDFRIEVSADGSSWTTVANRTGYPRPSATAQTFPFAPVNARHVRVTGTHLSTDQFGHYHMQLAELEALGGNLASGRAVTASSSVEYQNEGWLRKNLTDGARSALWYSMGWSSNPGAAARTEWASVDLGGPTRFTQVDLYARTDGENTGGGFPLDFRVEVSSDGSAWTTVASRTGYPRPDAGPQTFTFAATTARYVRVTGTAMREDPFHMQLSEVEVRQA